MRNSVYNFPTILTLIRLIVSPLLIPVLFVVILPLNIFKYNLILAIIFIIICLTDFLDGYLARLYHMETALGRLLDPIADKFLLYSSLIGLVYVHKIFFFWPIIFIGREFFIMALREVALSNGFSIKVSNIGKIKTTIQLIYITFLILNPYNNLDAPIWNTIELILLILALFFTIYSAVEYYKVFIQKFKNI